MSLTTFNALRAKARVREAILSANKEVVEIKETPVVTETHEVKSNEVDVVTEKQDKPKKTDAEKLKKGKS
jgi:hypothetical protein